MSSGAYGVIINNKAGAPGAVIGNNTFSGLSGGWTHAIGLEGPTPNALVTGNTFSNITAAGADKSAVFFEANPDGGSVTVALNSFEAGFNGVALHPNDLPGGSNSLNYIVNATNNWWGNTSGPDDGGLGTTDPSTGTPATGSGAIVGPNVRFDPWLGAETEEVSSGTPAGGDSVSLPGDEVVVKNTGAGSPTIVVAKYTSNPSSVGSFGSGGSYYDVNVNGSVAGDSLEITISTGGSTGNLYYYNGTVWKPVVAYSDGSLSLGSVSPSTSVPGSYVFVLNNTDTKPLLSDLTGTAFTGASAEIRLDPDTIMMADGETTSVEVQATSSALYGVDVSLAFNAANLEVAKVVLGGDLAADVVAVNEAGADTLRFAFSQKADAHPNEVSGDSATPILLATIVFRSTAPGTGTDYLVDPEAIYLTSALFSDKDGNDTAPGLLNDSGNPVAITINPSPRAYVDIALQGRGATVAANSGAVLEMKPTGAGSVLYSTAAAAQLEINPVPAGTYDVRVSAPKYLAAIQTVTIAADAMNWDLNGTVKDTPSGATLTLQGGDINGDDKINIQDLVLIGINFGSTDQNNLANINDDTTGVNIQDLAVAAGNFGAVTNGTTNYADPWTH